MTASTLYIAGDSHIECFKYAQKFGIQEKAIRILASHMAPGKTAQGLYRAQNQTMYRKRIEETVKEEYPDYIAIQLGEVDCGHTLWSRMLKNKTTKAIEIDYAIGGIVLLAEIFNLYCNKQIILLGPIIPLVAEYGEDTPKLLWPRKSVNASQQERTNLTLKFNNKLKSVAKKHKYLYLDINEQLLDPDTKVAKLEYQNKHSLHHIGAAKGAKLWMAALVKLLEERQLNVTA